MGAKHGGSLGRQIQIVEDVGNSTSREQTKVDVVQNKSPPNIHNVSNRGIAGIGTVYPINAPIDDRGTVADAVINVAMTSPLHHYVKIGLNNANPTINFTNLIRGVTTTFTIDMTNVMALSSIAFTPTLVNAPTFDQSISARNVWHIVAHSDKTIPTANIRYEVIGTGTGGISFPITPTILDLSDTWSGTQNINLAATTAHVTKIILDQNATFTFSNPPSSGTQIEFEVELTQDATGGFTVTWPLTVVNTPTVDTTALATTIVVFRTNDGGTTYRSVSTSGTGGDASLWANFTAVSDVDAGTFDVKNVDRLILTIDSGAVGTASDIAIYADTTGDMNFNVATTDAFEWSINDVRFASLFPSGLDRIFYLEAIDNGTPIIQIQKIDSTPSAGASVGRIEFKGVDTSGSTTEEFGRIRVDAEDLTVGSVDGSMHFGVDKSSSSTTFISLNNSNDNKVSIWKNIQMQTGIDIELNDNDLFVSADGLDRIYHSGTQMNFDVDSALQFYVVAGGISLASTSKSATLPNISMTPHDLTPLNVNGNMYYDLSEQKFKAYENGAWVDMISAISGADTALSNLASVAINTSLLPVSDGALDLGSATKAWDDVWTEKLKIEVGGAVTTTQNMIYADSFGMIFNVPTGDQYTYRMNGNPILIIEEDEIRFGVSGKQHRINATTASIDIVAENATDSVELWCGTSSSNSALDVESFRSTFRTTTTDTQAYVLQLVQNNNTPAAFRTLANIDFIAENSISVDTQYARISASSQVLTSTVEDGLLQLGISSGGTLIAAIDMEGSGVASTNAAKIGFFGVAPVVRPTGVAVSSAGIHAALVSLGLIT